MTARQRRLTHETLWTVRMQRRARGVLSRGEARHLAQRLIGMGELYPGAADTLRTRGPFGETWAEWTREGMTPTALESAKNSMRSYARDRYWHYGPLP